MIQRDKNLEAKQNVQKIIVRAQNIKQQLKLMFEWVYFTQQAYQKFCKSIFNDLTQFQNKISKNCLYQPEKTNTILRLSKQYRQFPAKIQNYAQINLNRLSQVSQFQQMNKHQLQLQKKAETFYNQFKNYSASIIQYNVIYQNYINHCSTLNEIISKFKSYSDPLKFYNKSITSKYQDKLESNLNASKNQQTKITTELQLLDSKRKFLDQSIKQIREIFTHLFHTCLKFVETIVHQIADSGKDNNIAEAIKSFALSTIGITTENQAPHSQTYDAEFQRLNTFTSLIDEGNQIMSDFNDILKDKKSKKFNQQIVSDHRLFNMRCENLKNKKQKAFQQCLILHEHLLSMFDNQLRSYRQFQRQFKQRQKKIFGLNRDNYKKGFKMFFGPKSFQIHQLCFYIIQIPRKSFQQISLWIADNFVIFKQVIESKKQSMAKFSKFYEQIMSQHLRQKQKFESCDPNDTQISQTYRANIVSSLDQFKFVFSQLEAKQSQKDKLVAQKLITMQKFISKQYDICKIQKILQNHFDQTQHLKTFKVISEAMNVFKSDSLYNILYEEFFSTSLQKSFQSKINNKQYSQAEVILKQKEKIAKKMLKSQIGCCGLIKAKPIQSQILCTHKCWIYSLEKNNPHGTLKILKQGLTFQQSSWNPFAQKIHILIPKSDIQSIESKSFTQSKNQGVSVSTEKGPLVFISNEFDVLFSELQKNYGQTYRKSLAIDKKYNKNDSTDDNIISQSKSMRVSYNKDQKIFVEQPICMNPALSKMSNQISVDKKLRSSNIYTSDQYKELKQPKVKSQRQLKQQEKIRQMYTKLIDHYSRHQFLPSKFIYITNKDYRSNERKDYQFNDAETHNQFTLKQLKTHKIIESTLGVVLEIYYEWKVCYPITSSLHSFKHGQKIIINLNQIPSSINIIQWPHAKQQVFNRHFLFESINEMNQQIWKYIVQNTNRDFLYDPVVQKEYDPIDDSNQIMVDDFRQIGVTYPQDFQFKGSRYGAQSLDLKLPIVQKNQLRMSSVLKTLSTKGSVITSKLKQVPSKVKQIPTTVMKIKQVPRALVRMKNTM